MNITINGFGRIGRATFKILLERIDNGDDINIVGINDLSSIEQMAYLLKYDSVYGVYEKKVVSSNNSLIVDNKEYPIFNEKDPSKLPWKDLEIDIVFECTGVFTDSEGAGLHKKAGAKKVVVSAPTKDEALSTKVLGCEGLTFDDDLVSNASCTTNSVTPVLSVLDSNFGVEKAMLTTVHAYTVTQSIVDAPSKKDFRKGRAAAQNIIPTSTGAAIATTKVLTSLEKKFDGVALRVPVKCGSISDLTLLLKKNVTVEDVNKVFRMAQDSPIYKGILKYTEEPLVSNDILKTSYSAILDGKMTRVVGGNLVKVMAWYDNEWGYSNRLVDVGLAMMRNS